MTQCKQAHELLALLNNPLVEISTVRILSTDLLEVSYKRIDQDTDMETKTNIFVAAFTTCQARLKLYESLETLGTDYDTHSVTSTWKPSQSEIPLGDYLGDMTNELDDGDYITEFVSGGAKNYGYVTKQGKTVCKVRGFSLNVRGSLQLNYEVMKNNILRANVSIHRTNSCKSPKFVFTPTFIFCSPICFNNCRAVFL